MSLSQGHCAPYTAALTAFEGVGPGPHGAGSPVGGMVAHAPRRAAQARVDFERRNSAISVNKRKLSGAVFSILQRAVWTTGEL